MSNYSLNFASNLSNRVLKPAISTSVAVALAKVGITVSFKSFFTLGNLLKAPVNDWSIYCFDKSVTLAWSK